MGLAISGDCGLDEMTRMTDWKRRYVGINALFGLMWALTFGFVAAPSPAVAQEATKRVATCVQNLPGSLGFQDLSSYSVQARSNPPSKTFLPGEKYSISYVIKTDCVRECGEILPVDLQHKAILGADRSKLDQSSPGIGSTYVIALDCNEDHWISVAFTVPSPQNLGAESGVSTVSMGLCPPSWRYNCAGHTIRVRNAPIGEWKLSAPSVRLRTITGEYPAGRSIPMSVDVTNFSGKNRFPGEPGGILIKQSSGSGPVGSVASLSLPPVSDLQSTPVPFSVQPASPGIYSYFVCLSGLNDPNGWPLADICGPQTEVTVGPPVLPTPQPQDGVQHLPAPADGHPPMPGGGEPLPGMAAPAAANCTGGRLPDSTGRCVCPGGTQWSATANHCVTPQGGVPRLPPPGGAAPLPAGALPPPAPNCTGGRSPDAQGRCVCPAGTQWNAGANQCATPQAAAPAPAGQLECRGGEVKGILCWCGIGRFPRAVGNNVYQCQ